MSWFNFGKDLGVPRSPAEMGELEDFKKNNRRVELEDRIDHLKEMIEKAETNLEARASFEKQLAETQAELAKLDGSGKNEPEKTETVN